MFLCHSISLSVFYRGTPPKFPGKFSEIYPITRYPPCTPHFLGSFPDTLPPLDFKWTFLEVSTVIKSVLFTYSLQFRKSASTVYTYRLYSFHVSLNTTGVCVTTIVRTIQTDDKLMSSRGLFFRPDDYET